MSLSLTHEISGTMPGRWAFGPRQLYMKTDYDVYCWGQDAAQPDALCKSCGLPKLRNPRSFDIIEGGSV